jgi:hypothetical protein
MPYVNMPLSCFNSGSALSTKGAKLLTSASKLGIVIFETPDEADFCPRYFL